MKQAKAAPVGAAFAGHSFSVGALPFRLTGSWPNRLLAIQLGGDQTPNFFPDR